jgi:hypothetical protein
LFNLKEEKLFAVNTTFKQLRMKYIKLQLFVWLMLLSFGCGSAEAIKSYDYPVNKANLDIVLHKVLYTNPHIVIDATEPKVIVRRNPGDPNDTSTISINQSNYHGKDSAWMADDEKGITR